MFSLKAPQGRSAPYCKFGTLHISVFCSLTTLRQIIFMFFILALRQVCYQGHGSKSNVVVSYVKDSVYATAFCGVV